MSHEDLPRIALPEGPHLASWDAPPAPFSLRLHGRLTADVADGLIDDMKMSERVCTTIQFDAFQENLARWRSLYQSARLRRPRGDSGRVALDPRRTGRRMLLELSNTLTSAFAYIDSREADTIRAFGDGSQEHVRLLQLFSAQFDGVFGYRLCGKLRNVLVHAGLAPVLLTEYLDGDGVRRYGITTTPAMLLASSQKWGGPLTRELRTMDREIDIVDAINELATCLTIIEEWCVCLHLDSAKAAATRLLQAIDLEGLGGVHAVCIVDLENQAANTVNFSGLQSVSPVDLARLAMATTDDLAITYPSRPEAPAISVNLEALALMQAHLVDDTPGLIAAVNTCLSDPQTAGDSILSLCSVASISLHEIETVLGMSALEQLSTIHAAGAK